MWEELESYGFPTQAFSHYSGQDSNRTASFDVVPLLCHGPRPANSAVLESHDVETLPDNVDSELVKITEENAPEVKDAIQLD